MEKRALKDLLYEQVARIGKAASSPKRLELLALLAQGEKTVELLAAEASINVKLASAHLKALREARLVTFKKDGKFAVYRLGGDDVADLWVAMRELAETHLTELRVAVDQMVAAPGELVSMDRAALMSQAEVGDLVVIDVRPRREYDRAHLPFARSMPLAEIGQRLSELPRDKDIVAYCRGPFCFFSDDACQLLNSRGYRVRKLLDGVSEWRAAGMPLVEQHL